LADVVVVNEADDNSAAESGTSVAADTVAVEGAVASAVAANEAQHAAKDAKAAAEAAIVAANVAGMEASMAEDTREETQATAAVTLDSLYAAIQDMPRAIMESMKPSVEAQEEEDPYGSNEEIKEEEAPQRPGWLHRILG
jgi:ABC-type Zn uptake system ZnuABC Zn-binding protein ZnuA